MGVTGDSTGAMHHGPPTPRPNHHETEATQVRVATKLRWT